MQFLLELQSIKSDDQNIKGNLSGKKIENKNIKFVICDDLMN